MDLRKIAGGLSPSIITATKEIKEAMFVLQEHLIQVQNNQVEFEKYLKDIKKMMQDGKTKK